MSDDHDLRTRLVHEGVPRSEFNETSEPMMMTSGFVYNSAEEAEGRFLGENEGYIYSRFSNPTVHSFERRMAALEGSEVARATATGMAAISSAMLCYLNAGDHIVASRALFGSCRYVVETLMPRFGIQSTLVDGRDMAAWEAAVRPNTRALFLETPTNPQLEIVDIRGVSALAKSNDALLFVDNVFSSPVFQKPLELGADVVMYSTTKHIDGQGRCLGGVVCCSKAFDEDYLFPFTKHTGPALSPFNAWVMLKSLETLTLRVNAMAETATGVADTLAGHRSVDYILYPSHPSHPQQNLAMSQMSSGGTVIALEVGTKERAFRTLNGLELIKISNNLGDSKSLITHPATTTHQNLTDEAKDELAITPGLLRLSIGLESVQDIEADLVRALDRAG